MTDKPNVVLYHDNCIDGMTSAFVARRKLGDSAEYIPVQYGRNDALPDMHGKNLYILDFCYPSAVIERMATEVASLTILDHHKTAEADMREAKHRLKEQLNVYIHFDMERSGAGLTAQFFHDFENWWVDYVEDRDLWRFALPNSKNINAYIQSVERSMDAYDRAYSTVEKEEANVLGMGALQYLEMYTKEMVALAVRVPFLDHQSIPVVNTPYVGTSEVVGELAKSAPFAVGWFLRGDTMKVSFSLRSRGEGVDVSEIAKQFGGGGHRGAAGFSLPMSEAMRRFGEIFGVAI